MKRFLLQKRQRTQKVQNSILILSILLLAACSFEQANDTPNEAKQAQASSAKSPSVSQRLEHYLKRDIKNEVFYFVMPDRFHNANPRNDNGDPSRPISYGGFDPTWERGFHGGDIAGLSAKLDYLENLGVTAIWMTPILRNKAVQWEGVAHHGYWVVDFTEIDPHFGTNEDLKQLISQAHQRNIKIFFDIITNHTADVIKFEECHDVNGQFLDPDKRACDFKTQAQLDAGDDYTPFVLESEKEAKVPAWLNDPAIYNNQGDSIWQGESVITGDFAGLDDINTSLPEVQQNMIAVFKDLITNFRPDGFRIDTVKHVDLAFWQVFTPAIVEHAKSIGIPEFFVFGEVYDGNPSVLSTFTTQGKMPSVLDFGFHFNVKDALFSGMDVARLAHLFDNDDYYRDHDSSPLELMNFLGNHDAGRVGLFINQGFPDIDDEERLARSLLGHSLMYFSRGIPVVYYGDEQGFTGDAGDIGARENMDPSLVSSYNDNDLIGTELSTANDNFDQGHPIYQKLATLAEVRSAHKTLSHGHQHNRLADDDKRIFAFSRVDHEDMHEYLAVFNFDTQTQVVSINADAASYENVLGHKAIQKSNTLHFELPSLSYSLHRSTEALPYSIIADFNIMPRYKENMRVIIPTEVRFTTQWAVNAISVAYYSISVEGVETYLATDTTYPYRLILDELQTEVLSKLKVVVDNHNGQRIEKFINL